MTYFVDTNLFIATIVDEPELGPLATEVLSSDQEFLTSVLNLMELRTVLTKKRRMEPDRAQEIQSEITADVDVIIPDASDVMQANRIQQETLLYPLDSLILACARAHNAPLVSFDSELLDAGATHPEDVL